MIRARRTRQNISNTVFQFIQTSPQNAMIILYVIPNPEDRSLDSRSESKEAAFKFSSKADSVGEFGTLGTSALAGILGFGLP
jgi:hypothetical protein